MNTKYKVLVYPFDMEFLSTMNYSKSFTNIEIKYLLSPFGWKAFLENIIDMKVFEKEINNYLHYEISDEMKAEYDTFYLTNSFIKLNYEKYIFPKVKAAIVEGKRIIINRLLSKKQFSEIQELADANNVQLLDYSNRIDESFFTNQYLELAQINTPVVFIAGTTEQTNKFDIQLYIRDQLSKIGYNVSSIGTRTGCELLGFHSYPKFMLDNSISEVDKILYFNKFVKEIENEENPDIIIIGIPGSTIPLDTKHRSMNYCVSCFEISQSVKPDFVLLSLSFDKYEDKYFEDVENLIKYKYGFDIDCYHISNIMPDQNSLNELELSYVITPKDDVSTLMNEYYKDKDNVFSLHNCNSKVKMVSYIIEQLSQYNDVKFL